MHRKKEVSVQIFSWIVGIKNWKWGNFWAPTFWIRLVLTSKSINGWYSFVKLANFWNLKQEMPLNQLIFEEIGCAMVDSCPPYLNQEELFDVFMTNFYRHYNSNRAPLGNIFIIEKYKYSTHYCDMFVQLQDFISTPIGSKLSITELHLESFWTKWWASPTSGLWRIGETFPNLE